MCECVGVSVCVCVRVSVCVGVGDGCVHTLPWVIIALPHGNEYQLYLYSCGSVQASHYCHTHLPHSCTVQYWVSASFPLLPHTPATLLHSELPAVLKLPCGGLQRVPLGEQVRDLSLYDGQLGLSDAQTSSDVQR